MVAAHDSISKTGSVFEPFVFVPTYCRLYGIEVHVIHTDAFTQ